MDNPSAYKFNENKMAFLIVACMRFPDKMIILFLFFHLSWPLRWVHILFCFKHTVAYEKFLFYLLDIVKYFPKSLSFVSTFHIKNTRNIKTLSDLHGKVNKEKKYIFVLPDQFFWTIC